MKKTSGVYLEHSDLIRYNGKDLIKTARKLGNIDKNLNVSKIEIRNDGNHPGIFINFEEREYDYYEEEELEE